jgi:hypothetical protein
MTELATGTKDMRQDDPKDTGNGLHTKTKNNHDGRGVTSARKPPTVAAAASEQLPLSGGNHDSSIAGSNLTYN